MAIIFLILGAFGVTIFLTIFFTVFLTTFLAVFFATLGTFLVTVFFFVIDFFTPETIDALGSLITGRPSNQATSDYYAYQTARTRQTGLILGGAILIVILILMYKLLTSK